MTIVSMTSSASPPLRRYHWHPQWVAVEADTFADGSGASLPANFSLSCSDWAAGEGWAECAATLHSPLSTLLLPCPPAGPAASLPLTAVTAQSDPPVAATPVSGSPGVWAVTGLLRGAAAAFYPSGSPGPAGGDFVVAPAAGRNASEFNTWGSRFVYRGELP